MQHTIKQDQAQFAQNTRQETRKNHEDLKIWMMQQWGNRRPEEEEPSPPTTLNLPSTSKRSRDTSTLTQNTYETSNLIEVIQAKISIGKAQKTPTTTKTTPIEKSIDFAPAEEMIDYEMNGMPHDYGPYPEYRDDPDDDPLL